MQRIYLVPSYTDVLAVTACNSRVFWHPSLLQSQFVVPHRTGRISLHRTISNLPSPEKVILESIHVGQSIVQDALFGFIGIVEPFFYRGTISGSRELKLGSRVDTVEPVATVVNRIGPFTTDNNAVISRSVIGTATPTTDSVSLDSVIVGNLDFGKCQIRVLIEAAKTAEV